MASIRLTTSPSAEAPAQPGLLSSIGQTFLNLMFSPRCGGCGRVDAGWCAVCALELDAVPLDISVRQIDGLTVTTSGLHRGILQRAIQAFKYEGSVELAEPLARRLVSTLATRALTFDMILSVPLHTSRRRERGYNQSQLLAEKVATHLALPSPTGAIVRQRVTRPQVGLTGEQRRVNMEAAFLGKPEDLAQQRLLIIDDVCTTGATLSACAQAALAAGAKYVYGLAVTTPPVSYFDSQMKERLS